MSAARIGKIVFASGKVGDYDLWSVDLDNGHMRQLTHGKYWNDKPKWSPDGRSVVFTSNRGGGDGQEIYRVGAEGGEPVPLTSLGRWVDAPVYSPDGSRIAFISNEAGNQDVWIMDAEGGNRTQVTKHPGSDKHVRWTPDGNGLLFSSDRDKDADIWQIDLPSGRRTQLNADRGADITPVPSPDGTLIAFVSDRQHEPDPADVHTDRDKDVWMMRADGAFPVRLTRNQGADFCPCWSPDGASLMYTADTSSSDTHLRTIDLRELRIAYATGVEANIRLAAERVRPEIVTYDRSGMKSDVGARRTRSLLTFWMPDSWVERLYPVGFFGKERNPDWVGTR